MLKSVQDNSNQSAGEKKINGPLLEYINEINEKVMEQEVTEEDELRFKLAKVCGFCDRHYSNTIKDLQKVRHQDHHRPDEKIIIMCSRCNLSIIASRKLHLLCHNGTGFDYHFLLKALGPYSIRNIRAIPKNTERFLGFIFNDTVKIMDSILFLNNSL